MLTSKSMQQTSNNPTEAMAPNAKKHVPLAAQILLVLGIAGLLIGVLGALFLLSSDGLGIAGELPPDTGSKLTGLAIGAATIFCFVLIILIHRGKKLGLIAYFAILTVLLLGNMADILRGNIAHVIPGLIILALPLFLVANLWGKHRDYFD
jgi:hypothetical protein